MSAVDEIALLNVRCQVCRRKVGILFKLDNTFMLQPKMRRHPKGGGERGVWSTDFEVGFPMWLAPQYAMPNCSHHGQLILDDRGVELAANKARPGRPGDIFAVPKASTP